MPIFRRKKPEPVMPDWAVPLWTAQEYDTFLAIVSVDLGRRGQAFELDPETGSVTFPPDAGVAGLANLGQLCAASPSEEWPDLVEAHFDNLAGPKPAIDAMSYEEAEPLLRVRVVPADFFDEMAAQPAAEALTDDLLVTAVVDFPKTIGYVTAPRASDWGRTIDELIAKGLDNLSAAGEKLEIENITTADDVHLIALMGESHYTATSVLALDTLLAPLPEDGVIVGLPHRHVVLVHRIEDAGAIAAVAALGPMVRNMYDEGPGSISPHLYWLRNDGTLLPLPMELTDDGVSFTPPDEFLELLNRLAGGDDSAPPDSD